MSEEILVNFTPMETRVALVERYGQEEGVSISDHLFRETVTSGTATTGTWNVTVSTASGRWSAACSSCMVIAMSTSAGPGKG